jgi:hypothetical protein
MSEQNEPGAPADGGQMTVWDATVGGKGPPGNEL